MQAWGALNGAAYHAANRVCLEMAMKTANLGAPLSPRELEITACICRGLSNKEIARALAIEIGTVKFHVHRILRKLGTKNRTSAAMVLIGKNGG